MYREADLLTQTYAHESYGVYYLRIMMPMFVLFVYCIYSHLFSNTLYAAARALQRSTGAK